MYYDHDISIKPARLGLEKTTSTFTYCTCHSDDQFFTSHSFSSSDRVLIDNVVEQNCRRQNEEEFTNDCKEYCVPTKSDRFGPCKKHSDCNMWPCSAGPNKPGVNLKCVKGGELCKKKINYDDCCDAPCTYNNLDSLNWASGIWNSFTCVSDYYCEGDDLCENKNCPSKAYHDTWML